MQSWNGKLRWNVFFLSLFLFGSFQQAGAADVSRAIRLVDRPALSPDGSKIAFSWTGEIWSANIDGSNLTRLTNNPASDSQPLFSPDGGRIAFVSSRTGSLQIFVMQSDGTLPKQVSFHSAGTSSAAVNDVGRLRTPFRGWFLPDTGQDMELNGCVPDAIVWPKPSELPEGIDRQLDKAVELLLQEVGQGTVTKELIYATQRGMK